MNLFYVFGMVISTLNPLSLEQFIFNMLVSDK